MAVSLSRAALAGGRGTASVPGPKEAQRCWDGPEGQMPHRATGLTHCMCHSLITWVGDKGEDDIYQVPANQVNFWQKNFSVDFPGSCFFLVPVFFLSFLNVTSAVF